MERYSEGWDKPIHGFGLPPLRTEGQPERFDGEPMSIDEKSAWTADHSKRLRRNARRRELYRKRKELP